MSGKPSTGGRVLLAVTQRQAQLLGSLSGRPGVIDSSEVRTAETLAARGLLRKLEAVHVDGRPCFAPTLAGERIAAGLYALAREGVQS